MTLALAAGLAAVPVMAAIATRERRASLRRRSALFDGCLDHFEDNRKTLGPDGFARVEGNWDSRAVKLSVVPDNLTARRLPQLWLCVTIRARLPIAEDAAVLVRPNGAEFFSQAQRLPCRLMPPDSWPGGVLLRGSRPAAQALVDSVEMPMASLLQNAKVKEIAVTRQGLRAVYQADEGRRGDYLLLRQSAFAGSYIQPSTVVMLVDALLGIEHVLIRGPRHDTAQPRVPAFG